MEQSVRHENSDLKEPVRELVEKAIRQIASEQNISLAPLHDDLLLLQSGFDSLCLALLVANLEDELGVDPFTAAEDVSVPVTLGEFIELYEQSPRMA